MTESLAAEARRLRAEEGLSARQIQRRLGVNRYWLYEWLRGVEPPEWTKRPNAKDELRARASQLRHDGWSVPEIAVELGVARSTAFQWTRHIPLDHDTERARKRREHSKRMTDARWEAHRRDRDRRRDEILCASASVVGTLDERDLLLLGAAIYWCEGEKAKPWRPAAPFLTFVNSDPVLLQLFLRFLQAAGVGRRQLTYRVSIHETADAEAVRDWWAQRLDLPLECFHRPTLKRHRPRTNRRNIGDDYRGCLVIRVPRSRELYWRVEGMMRGLGEAVAHGQEPATV
jgi:transposase